MGRKRSADKFRENRELIAQLIVEGIKRSGRTATEICREAGVDPTYLSKVKKGTKSFGRAKISAFARVLEIPIDKLEEAAGYKIENRDILKMPLSEIISTWTAFDRYGITREHLARIRNDPEFAKTIAQTFRLLS